MRPSRRLLFAGIIASYVALALVYNVVEPIWEAPDKTAIGWGALVLLICAHLLMRPERASVGYSALLGLCLNGGKTLLVYHLRNGLPDSQAGYRATDAVFDNGMALVGYRVVPATSRRVLRIDLIWGFAGPVSGKPPTVFNHLLNAPGEKVAQVDGLARGVRDWQSGDACFDEFSLSRPTAPGPYLLQVGLYDYPSMQRFHLSRVPPGAPDDAVRLGPV